MLELCLVVARRRLVARARGDDNADILADVAGALTSMEVVVLDVLADTYGFALLADDRFAPVVDFLVESDAVAIVKKVLWGDSKADRWMAVLLSDALMPLNLTCSAWPEVFMAEVRQLLKKVMSKVYPFRRQNQPYCAYPRLSK